MPSKPDFDPFLHLLEFDENENDIAGRRVPPTQGPGSQVASVHSDAEDAHGRHRSDQSPNPLLTEADDEALARMLQEQFEEEVRNLQSTDRRNQVGDMELARIIQNEENAQSALHDIHLSGAMSNASANEMNYAARIHGEDFNSGPRVRGEPCGTESSLEDNDRELARCMQQLEQMGMGRLNSNRNGLSIEASVAERKPVGRSESDSDSFRSHQEEEDARLANLIAGGADSARVFSSDSPVRTASTPHPKPPIQPSDQNRYQSGSADGVPTHVDPRTGSKSAIGSPYPPPDPPRILSNPPGIDIPSPDLPSQIPETKKKKKRGILNTFLGKGGTDKGNERTSLPSSAQPRGNPCPRASVPSPIPPAPRHIPGPLPYSVSVSTHVRVPIVTNAQHSKKKAITLPSRNLKSISCSGCGKSANSFLIAIDKKYHQECFKCIGCHTVIDSSGPFAYMTDEHGEKHPLHRKCYAELYGVKCAVCKQSIPAGPDGKVSFVKHPFFDTEQMCPKHAANPGRRCTGCHRFEPDGQPFADLGDSNRCVCFSCCRTVVVDGNDAKPLWSKVISFFEQKLKLPIWKDLRQVPVLIVGFDALNDQLMNSGGAHGGSSQIMTRGLCLTEHQSGKKFKLSRLKFDKQNQSFEACDVEENGFTFFQIPDANKVNPDASVTAILCLSGLPGDLAASVLAHEATHAWIKLHPAFKIGFPIPPMVEEGVAQLVAMLFLTDGLDQPSSETYGDKGPSDEKLRQYFKFSIETDDHEIYGEGYRKAAKAYADIGIEALLSHVVLYKEFPTT